MEVNKSYEPGDLMTISEVRNILNISLSAAYQLCRQDDFTVCRFGGNIRIPRDAFYAWLEERTHIPSKLSCGD